jgi:hypothetical protein
MPVENQSRAAVHAYEQPRFREAKDIGDPFVKPPPREVFLCPLLIKIMTPYKARHLQHNMPLVVLM